MSLGVSPIDSSLDGGISTISIYQWSTYIDRNTEAADDRYS